MARLYNLHAGHALAGIAAVMAGHQVKYVMATKLVNEFLEAVDELILTQTFARYGRLGLLSIDELGSLALGPWPLALGRHNDSRMDPQSTPQDALYEAGRETVT